MSVTQQVKFKLIVRERPFSILSLILFDMGKILKNKNGKQFLIQYQWLNGEPIEGIHCTKSLLLMRLNMRDVAQ
jgi:hypothetical protein